MPNTLPGVYAETIDVADAPPKSIRSPSPEVRSKLGLYLAMAAALFAASAAKPTVAQAQQPDRPGNGSLTGGVDGGKKLPEKSPDQQRISDALLDAPDIAKLVSDLEHDEYRKREDASKELAARILKLVAIQNPPPAGYFSAIDAAKNPQPKFAEQNRRMGDLSRIAEGRRWNDGSRFPPTKGEMTKVLDEVCRYTGTSIRLPVGSPLRTEIIDVPLGKNSVWAVVQMLEAKGLGIEGFDGNAIVLTDKWGKGRNVFACNGQSVLLTERNQLPGDAHRLSVMGEPGMSDPLLITHAKASQDVHARDMSLPRFPLGAGYDEARCFRSPHTGVVRLIDVDAETWPRPSPGNTTLNVLALSGSKRTTVTVPLEPGQTKGEKLGPVQRVTVTTQKDGAVVITLIAFEDVPTSTRIDVDVSLREISRRAKVGFVDKDGNPLNGGLMPVHQAFQRNITYTVPRPPDGAVAVRVTGFGDVNSIGGTFIIPDEKIRARPQPVPQPRVVPEPVPPPRERSEPKRELRADGGLDHDISA